MKVYIWVVAIALITGVISLGGCISSNEEKIYGSIQNLEVDSKLYITVDSIYPDSNVTVNYSLGIHHLVIGNRYRIEVEFKSQSNQFIQWYGTESFATDSNAMYLWSFPRAKDQTDTQVQANLKINNIQLSQDTALYQSNKMKVRPPLGRSLKKTQ